MTDTLTPTTTEYYRRVAELSTVPFWQLDHNDQPSGPERMHVWHWNDVVPELIRSQELVDDDATTMQRRALLLRNPGLAAPAIGATQTLVAAYQMLLPGEAAPVHAHSFSALRFGVEGNAARMIVDGDAVPLCPGDLVLTPAWCWHGHTHPGGHDPVVWFDGLDVPFVGSLRAGFYRSAPATWDHTSARATSGTAPTGTALAPIGDRTDRHSPVRRYPWDEAYPTLQRLMARADDDHGATLEYRNPVNGGPALATIACSLQGVPPSGRSRSGRETASSVYLVARGSGSIVTEGDHRTFATNDVIAVPAWTRHHFCAGNDELILFRISDRPLHDAFGLYRAEV